MYWNYKDKSIIPSMSTQTLIRPRNRSEITPGKLNPQYGWKEMLFVEHNFHQTLM